MKGVKLYIIALLFSVTWWTANRILDFYTFTVPVHVNVHLENDELRFQKDTVVQIDFSAKGYEWLWLLATDTIHLEVANEGLSLQKHKDVLSVRINASVIQRKVDSLLGRRITLSSATNVTLRDTFLLRKKVYLVLPEIQHPVKGCFLCSSLLIEPATVILEGKPSLLERIDSIILKLPPDFQESCRNVVIRLMLPVIHGVNYLNPGRPFSTVTLPFCQYKHFSVERFYRFEFDQRIYEGTVHVEGYLSPHVSIDSLQVMVDIKNNRHAVFRIKNSSLFKDVQINPAEIELK